MIEFKISDYLKPDKKGLKVLKWEFFSNLNNNNIWKKIINEKELKINLNKIDLFNHDGIIWIAFISLYRNIKNFYTEILLPYDMEKVSYLSYIGFEEISEISNTYLSNVHKFVDLAEDRLKKKSEREFKHYQRDNYEYSIQRIQLIDNITCDKITNYAKDYIEDILIKRSDFNPTGQEAFEFFNSFHTSLKEILQNVSDHGFFIVNQSNQNTNGIDIYRKGEGIGFTSCTPPRKKSRAVRLCCSDVGSGLFSTLKKKITRDKLTDERDAVIEAYLYRYFNKVDGIIGLFPILEYVRMRKGKIKIRFGEIYSILDLSKPSFQDIFDKGYSNPSRKWITHLLQFYHSLPKIPGTHIIIELYF